MSRYGTAALAGATSIALVPIGPAARIWTCAEPRVVVAEMKPA